MIAARRLAVVAAAVASLSTAAWPAVAMVDKPTPRKLTKPAVGVTAAPAASAATSAPAPASDDPMERLRQRLAERLAAPGGSGAATGTLDLQISSRAPAAPERTQATEATAARVRSSASGPRAAGAVAAAAAATVPAAPAALPAAPAALPAAPAALPSTAAALPAAAGALPAATAALPAAASPRPPRPGTAPAGAGRGSAGGGAAAAHWGYEGAVGPKAWGGLRPEFGLCANGQRQSPIDIRDGLAVDLDPVRFEYRPTPFRVIDNGHTVQVNLPPGNAIEVGARRYELVQFHFHRPSEERIDGRQFEMSLHLVHKDAAGRLAVVAVLLGKGPAHPAVQKVWNNLPLEKHEEAGATGPIDPDHLLPADKRYFTYMGSLTTPPCSEGVLWIVMRTPVTLAEEQLDLFARIYPMNARPVQPVAGRRILQSQ